MPFFADFGTLRFRRRFLCHIFRHVTMLMCRFTSADALITPDDAAAFL